MTQPDPITLLLRLRADMVRMAHQVDVLWEVPTRDRRNECGKLARRMRDAAMASDVVAACERVPDAIAEAVEKYQDIMK